jgi:hypothetical protein
MDIKQIWMVVVVSAIVALLVALVAGSLVNSGPDLAPRPKPSVGTGSGNVTHAECNNNGQCIVVYGPGSNGCNSNADCDVGNHTLPDLVVASISPLSGACGWGNQTPTCSVNMSVVVQNIGGNITGSSITQLVVYGGGMPPGVKNLPTPSLGPGQSVGLFHLLTNQSLGNYSATGIADWSDIVDEANENNNNLTIYYSLP